MEEDYYSINSIIADTHVRRSANAEVASGLIRLLLSRKHLQKLTCTFNLDVKGLGYLEGGSEPDVSRDRSLAGTMLD